MQWNSENFPAGLDSICLRILHDSAVWQNHSPCSSPVSYTHLDVYKRQMQFPAANSSGLFIELHHELMFGGGLLTNTPYSCSDLLVHTHDTLCAGNKKKHPTSPSPCSPDMEDCQTMVLHDQCLYILDNCSILFWWWPPGWCHSPETSGHLWNGCTTI